MVLEPQTRLSPENALSIYKDRRVLVTGHTGFKGSWLTEWLAALGAEVTGLALAPDQGPDNLFDKAGIGTLCRSEIVDLCDLDEVRAVVETHRPEIVMHLAAQPLVQRSYADPIRTFASNILGTAHLLEATRQTATVRAVVCVTTDKVYRNREWAWPYRETDELGGYDPYSASKAAAEMIARTYRSALAPRDRPFALATVRGGNVLGGGDWSENRLVPDMVRALRADVPLNIRNPTAVRPWQHVLDLCYAYLLIGAILFLRAPGSDVEAWNVGPDGNSTLTVQELVDLFFETWEIEHHPVSFEPSPNFESQALSLDSSLMRTKLGWTPLLDARGTIEATSRWYRDYLLQPQDARALVAAQRARFENSLFGREA